MRRDDRSTATPGDRPAAREAVDPPPELDTLDPRRIHDLDVREQLGDEDWRVWFYRFGEASSG